MKISTRVARRLLREANPVSAGAFADVAQDQFGQATLTAILDSNATSGMAGFAVPERAGTMRWRRVPARSRWRAAVPAATLTAALAATLAVALLMSGNPAPDSPPVLEQAADGALVELVANLTVHPSPSSGDASAELRDLAGIAAARPAPAALGPVEYSKAESWGLDLGTTHYGLSYRSHQSDVEETWTGSDGASLDVRTWPGGKVPEGNIPVGRSGPSPQGRAAFAWDNPATLPTSESLMRQHLLDAPGSSTRGTYTVQGSTKDTKVTEYSNGKITIQGPGKLVYQPPDLTSQIVTAAEGLMGSEPLPPAARAALLRVLADTAASPGTKEAFFDLGSVTDRAGHHAVAIGWEDGRTGLPVGPVGSTQVQPQLVVLVFDPGTGALVGEEYAYCKKPVGPALATGSCFATSYDQLLEIKAVQSIPATPTAAPDTPPSGPPAKRRG